MDHYAVPPQYYPLPRPSMFAKNLIKMGHEVTIIAASTVHNSDVNLITDGARVKKATDDGVPYVFIRCRGYRGNGLGRVNNILEFAAKLPGVFDTLIAAEYIQQDCPVAFLPERKANLRSGNQGDLSLCTDTSAKNYYFHDLLPSFLFDTLPPSGFLCKFHLSVCRQDRG